MQAAIMQRVSVRPFTASSVAPVRRVAVVAVAPSKLTTVEVEARGTRNGGKCKTRKAASKRFKVTGSGKLMARRAGKQHFNEKKSAEDLINLNKTFVISKTDVWNITKCMPCSGIGK